MPEQNTPVPIRRGDIRKGDRIHQQFDYTAGKKGAGVEAPGFAYFLLARPARHVAIHETNRQLVAEAMAFDFYQATGRTLPGRGRHSC